MAAIHHGVAWASTALAAALALSACDRSDRIPIPQTDPASTSSTAPTTTTGSSFEQAGAPISGSGTSAASTAALPSADIDFVTQAAEGGQFEVELARLALEKAADPAVTAYARMLVNDHSAANDTLRQIATRHNLALPASLPDEKKRQLEELSKLTGADFDRQFIQLVGIHDHHHHIEAFEKVVQSAQSEDVKSFAQSALPTLKKHLAAAEKLPSEGKTKG